MLTQLSENQETYRQMLIGMKGEGNSDKSFDSAMRAAALQGSDDDAVISVALAHLEMANDMAAEYQEEQRGPEENDLLYAMDFIDHLDTLGKVIVSK